MKLTVVRHTRVDVPKGICYGITDVALANTENADMKAVADRLCNERFDAAFTSPLGRCRALVGNITTLPATIDARLSELDFGDWEMKPWAEIYETEQGKKWFAGYLHTPCPNGSSYADMEHGVDMFLAELKRGTDENILIVTHAGVIRVLMSILENKKPEEAFEIPLDYGEIRHFEV